METKSDLSVFIVEDDIIYQEIIKNELSQKKFKNIEVFTSGLDCIRNLSKQPDVIILDYNLDKRMNGIQVLQKIKIINRDIQVIMLTSQEKLDVAINSMKYGAYDYIIKNDVAMKRLDQMVGRIEDWNNMLKQNLDFKKKRFFFLAGIGALITIIIILSFLFPHYFDFHNV